MPKEIFKTRLRKIRVQYGISQKDLADMLGVKRATISTYETGTNLPPIEVLVQLSRIFETSVDYFLGLTNYK